MKKSAFAIILLMIFPLIVTGCATNVGQATPKTQQDEKKSVVFINNQHAGISEEKAPTTDAVTTPVQEEEMLTAASTVDFISDFSVGELVSKSTVIVEGVVVGLDYFDFNTNTFTKAKIKVLNSFTDAVKAGDVVTFVNLGGITTLDKIKINSGGEGKPGATPVTEKDKHTRVQVLSDSCPLVKLNDQVLYFGAEDQEDSYKLSEKYYDPIGDYHGRYNIKGDIIERYYADGSPIKLSKIDVEKLILSILKDKPYLLTPMLRRSAMSGS